MSPVSGSVVDTWRVPIVVMLLLLTVSGCGRRREKSASAPRPESRATNTDAASPRPDASPTTAVAATSPQPGAPHTMAPMRHRTESPSALDQTEEASTTVDAPSATLPGAAAAAIASPRERAATIGVREAPAATPPARSGQSASPRLPAIRSNTSEVPAARAPSAIRSAPVDGPPESHEQPDETAAALPADVAPTEAAPNVQASGLPVGSIVDGTQGFTSIPVYYATDRRHNHVSLSAYEITGNKRLLATLGGCLLLTIALSAVSAWCGKYRLAATASIAACAVGAFVATFATAGGAKIEKHGVTYSGDRGSLTRGICEVTVPKLHRPGIVERPSVLRFEFREDQQRHIVLVSATELGEDEFHTRLANSVADSSEKDLLVFIHGYNVDFQSAIRRTAQIAVDLPFAGVPVCYTWPSQGSLLGYSVDETNAEWTTTHLKQFLMELVDRTGAHSISVIAHSMGNRPMTAAMEQIGWQLDRNSQPAPFDRIVLAAPDVDADRFRRDLGPSLSRVANHVTLYASSDDQALIASKQVHGYPRAGESGDHVVVVPGVETIDVSGIDLSLLGHSYYGDSQSMLRDLYQVVRSRLAAPERQSLIERQRGELVYWQLALQHQETSRH